MGKQGKQVVTATSAGVVIEDKTSRRRSLWQKAGLIFCLLVFAVALGAGVRWVQMYPSQKKETERKAVAKKVESIQDKALTGGFEESQKAIEKDLSNPKISDDEKYALLFQQGLNYENQKDYDQAIASYKAAAAVQSTQATAEATARVAEAKGDKQLAITYYKKAITLIPANYPLADSSKKSYEDSIKALGGQV